MKRIFLSRRFISQMKYLKHINTDHSYLLSKLCEFLHEAMGPNCTLTRMVSNPIPWLKWVIFPFLFVRTNLYSRFVYKYLEGILPVVVSPAVRGAPPPYLLV